MKPQEDLVVLPFEGESLRGGAVTERFRAVVATTVNDRIVITTALIAHKECAPGRTDDCLARVGQQQGFDWVLAGAVTNTSEGTHVAARLVPTNNPKATRSTTFEVTTSHALLAAAHSAWIRLSAVTPTK